MTYLEKIIKERGPILSSELLESLMNKVPGISREAARKRLSRVDKNIFRIKGIFADGQILFYDREIYGKNEYYLGLSTALQKAGKQYNIIIQSLEYHYGQLKLSHLPAYSINPTLAYKGT